MGNRILMIDTEVNESRKLKMSLEDEGYAVFISKNLEESFLITNANNIDLIIIFDVNIDINRLKNNSISSHIPLIGFFDISQKGAFAEFSELLDDCIYKPFEKGDLFKKIGYYIKIKKLQEEIKQKDEEIKDLNKQLNDFSLVDKQTGIYNSFYLKHILLKECEKAKRYGYNLSAVAFCIDEVSEDEAKFSSDLKELVDIIEINVRKSDIFVRLDKNEFYILLPYTGLKDALFVADKVRKQISGYQFNSGNKVTISAGVTTLDDIDRMMKKEDEMISRAKESMQKARDKGGNDIECC